MAKAWQAAGFALTTAVADTRRQRVDRDAAAGDAGDLAGRARSLGRPEVAILDTRSDGEYCGTRFAPRAAAQCRARFISSGRENLGPEGAFKPAGELRAMYQKAGVMPDRRSCTYCQGGYRAAHSYLALRLLGYPRVRNYLGIVEASGATASICPSNIRDIHREDRPTSQ